MTEYGVLSTGLRIKTQAIIESEIDEALKSVFGDQINTLPQSVFGQLKGIWSERESLLWEKIQDTYNSQYPQLASGTSLDNVASITGLTRNPATYSRVTTQAFFGTVGTVVPIGTVISVSGNSSSRFLTEEVVTLIAGTDEVQTITFSAVAASGSFKLVHSGNTTSAIAWDATAATIQTELRALASLSTVTVSGSIATSLVVTFTGDGTDGLQEQPLMTVSDSALLDAGAGAITITVTETVAGVYQGTSTMKAESTGAYTANERTLTVIENPISGLDSTFNAADASVGEAIETDAAFRLRRQERLQISRSGPADAIRNAILELNDVEDSVQIESCIVFENVTSSVDARGLPAKSFEVVVYQEGGATTRDQEIGDTIWLDAKPAGIQPHGDVSVTVEDSQGFSHTAYFSRPDEVDIYLILDLTTTSDYPTDGDDQVTETIVAWGNSLGVGQDVIVYGSNALVNQLDEISGITDVVVKIGTAPAPTLDDNISIDNGLGGAVELSRWESGNITVNS